VGVVYPASYFQSKTLEIPCDSSHVGEDFGTMVFVGEIGFSILRAEDDVVQELLMCAWHFTPLRMSPLRGFRLSLKKSPVPHGTG
jgi:hypothetical protein